MFIAYYETFETRKIFFENIKDTVTTNWNFIIDISDQQNGLSKVIDSCLPVRDFNCVKHKTEHVYKYTDKNRT